MSKAKTAAKGIDLDLIELIGCLSATEKQYFKRKFGSDADFVRIFTFISERKECNSILIRERLKDNTNPEKLSSGYLSSLKAYLKDRILESLRHQHENKKPSFEIVAGCTNADILIDKGLYRQARVEINKKHQKYNDQSWPIERLQLLRRSSILQFYENYEHSSYEEILDLYDERQKLAEQMLLEIKYAKILTILGYNYFKGIKDEKQLLSFMSEPYMIDAGLAEEFEAKYLYHWVHAQFHEMSGRPQQAIEHFQCALKEWHNHPPYIKAHTRMYLGACFTYLKHLLQLENPYQNIFHHEVFDDILSRIQKTKLEQDIKDQYQQLFTTGRILALRKEEEFLAILNDKSFYTEVIVTSRSITQFMEIMMNYLLALAHFQMGEFKLARMMLSDLIQSEKIQLHNNPEYFSHVLILSLLSLYELGELKYIRTLRPQYIKVLKKHGRYHEFEKIIFQMISQLSGERYKHHLHDVLARFYERVEKSLNKQDLHSHPDYRFYLDWIVSRQKSMPHLFLRKHDRT